VAIIMDGNGRWATQQGIPRQAGHKEGAKAVREISAGVVGRPEDLPTATRNARLELINQTASGTRMRLSLALSYSGRNDLVSAIRVSRASCVHPEPTPIADESGESKKPWHGGHPVRSESSPRRTPARVSNCSPLTPRMSDRSTVVAGWLSAYDAADTGSFSTAAHRVGSGVMHPRCAPPFRWL